jgi:hypothetical protein
LGFTPVPLDGHRKDGSDGEQKLDIVFSEFPMVRGVRAENAKGLALAGDGYGHAAHNAMINQ